MKTKRKSPTLNSNELIDELFLLKTDKKFKKPKTLSQFTTREAKFIRDLIFFKPKDLVYFYIADEIANGFGANFRLLYSRDHKRYKFLTYFISTGGNATRAAIIAGYSPRSAKQQGHRVLRYIQKASQS